MAETDCDNNGRITYYEFIPFCIEMLVNLHAMDVLEISREADTIREQLAKACEE